MDVLIDNRNVGKLYNDGVYIRFVARRGLRLSAYQLEEAAKKMRRLE